MDATRGGKWLIFLLTLIYALGFAGLARAEVVPTSSVRRLPVSNGFGAALLDLESARVTHFREHLFAAEEPRLDGAGAELWLDGQPQAVATRDLLYDAYFGLRVAGQQAWLTGDPVDLPASGYAPFDLDQVGGTGVATLVQSRGDLRITQYVFAPRGLSQAAVVMVAKVENTGTTTQAGISLFSLHNFHLGFGRPGVMNDIGEQAETLSVDLVGGRHDLMERGFAGVIVARPLGAVSHQAGSHSGSPNSENIFAIVNEGGATDLPDLLQEGPTQDAWVSGFQFDLGDLETGADAWVGLVFAHHGDPFAAVPVQQQLDDYVAGRDAEQLLDGELAAYRAFQQGLKVPSNMGVSDEALFRHGAVMLEMAQVKESKAFLREWLTIDGEARFTRFGTELGQAAATLPATVAHRGNGAILASLPPGEWTVAWIRDGAYAVAAMSAAGLFEQARAALQFYLNAEAGRFRDWQELAPYSMPPYRMSLVRYQGFGVEETDFNAFGPNLEFDGFGLFLWALHRYEQESGDAALADAHWSLIATEVADVLVALIDPQSGLLYPDSSIWESHWQGRQRRWTYTNITAARGLCDAAALAERMGDDRRATTYREAGEQLRAAIATQLVDASGALASNLEELESGGGYWDAAVLDAFAMELFDPQGKIAAATFAGLDEHLSVPAGAGWARNDDRFDHIGGEDLSPWGSEYDSGEWVITDLRGAVASWRAGDTARSERLSGWVRDQALANYLEVAEVFDEGTGVYKFNAPMIGFGAGAFILAQRSRDAAPDPACGYYYEETAGGGGSGTGGSGSNTVGPAPGCACRINAPGPNESGRGEFLVGLLLLAAALARRRSTPPPEDGEKGDEVDDHAPLVSAGNALRWWAALPLSLAAMSAIALMASSVAPAVAVPLGVITVLLAVVALLALLGTFDDEAPFATKVSWVEIRGALSLSLLAAACLLSLLRLAVAGYLPVWASAIGMPVAFLSTVASVYRLGERLGPWRYDEEGVARSLWRRQGWYLIVTATVLYLPMLGNHSLIDPWEPHYAEVAREILARGDWISLWWAQDGWFWSKPVLLFWVQALSMALCGVHHQPGQLLSGVAEGLSPQPEWALRMPVFLVAVLAVYFLYRAVARSAGRRAGLLCGLVLLTMPQFFFMAHQTMTDMFFVAFMTMAVAAFVLAVNTDPQKRIRIYAVQIGRREIGLTVYHLVLGAVFAVALPQIFYLLSRNIEFIDASAFGFSFRQDAFSFGSFENCGLPGNKACRAGLTPVMSALQPSVQALIWLQVVALFAWVSWGERRSQRLLFLAAWLFAALSTMAKGPAGLAFPVVLALVYVLATQRWRALTRMEIAAGMLVFAAAVLPWFFAMFVRHGQPYTDRLLFHDMFKRAFDHVHDTNKGDDTSFRYYLWQLAYAVFPWVGLAPAALVRCLGRRSATARHELAMLAAAWVAVGFVLFSVMGTKYHHYCFPLLPPLAVLIGLLLDEWFESADDDRAAASLGEGRRVLLGAVAVCGAALTLLVGRDLAMELPGRLSQIRLLHLFTYNYGRSWPETADFSGALWGFTGVCALLMAGMAVARVRKPAVLGLLLAASVFTAWGLDVYFVRLSPHWGQRELSMRYERARLEQAGQLIAYQMNWKGENFYRGNQLPVFVSSGSEFQKWIGEQKKKGDKVFYFLTQHKRLDGLRRELGHPRHVDLLTDKALNNKFALMRVRFE